MPFFMRTALPYLKYLKQRLNGYPYRSVLRNEHGARIMLIVSETGGKVSRHRIDVVREENAVKRLRLLEQTFIWFFTQTQLLCCQAIQFWSLAT